MITCPHCKGEKITTVYRSAVDPQEDLFSCSSCTNSFRRKQHDDAAGFPKLVDFDKVAYGVYFRCGGQFFMKVSDRLSVNAKDASLLWDARVCGYPHSSAPFVEVIGNEKYFLQYLAASDE